MNQLYISTCPETGRKFLCEVGQDNNLAEIFEQEKVQKLLDSHEALFLALSRCAEVIGSNSCSDGKTPNGFVVALEQARAALRIAAGNIKHAAVNETLHFWTHHLSCC